MSYDIDILDPATGECLEIDEPHQLRGGTYCVGGTRDLSLNVTYNYAPIFARVLGEGGVRQLDGMKVSDSLTLLEKGVSQLDGEPDADYWAKTDGNAKRALENLLALAHMGPGGVWHVA